jgi:diadenosine tetraphosphate (Ap4A) HIT family hydrolase
MTQPVFCEGADLCQEITGSVDNSFVRTYGGDPPSRLVLESAAFVLMADMSPLTVGHLLLLPKTHYLSFSALMRTHFDELENVMSRIEPYYSATFGEPLVIEHGSADESDGNACVTHAHWHLLPVDGTRVDALIRQDDLPSTDLADPADLGLPHWTNRSYYYTSYAGKHHVYQPSPATRRQYLRSVVGRVLSIDDPEWDYALVVRKNFLRETMNRVRYWSEELANPLN